MGTGCSFCPKHHLASPEGWIPFRDFRPKTHLESFPNERYAHTPTAIHLWEQHPGKTRGHPDFRASQKAKLAYFGRGKTHRSLHKYQSRKPRAGCTQPETPQIPQEQLQVPAGAWQPRTAPGKGKKMKNTKKPPHTTFFFFHGQRKRSERRPSWMKNHGAQNLPGLRCGGGLGVGFGVF